MITEKEGHQLNRGTTAAIARAYYDEHLMKKREQIINQLCGYYVTGDLQLPIICGKLGELNMINDSLKLFERDIKTAQTIEGKLHGE